MNIVKLFPVLIIIFLWLTTVSAAAQTCDYDSRPQSLNEDDFFVNDDGTITDLERGLTWKRCVEGQKWNGSTCVGNAKKFTWYKGKNLSPVSQGEQWRIPRLNELATIIERQCHQPRTNLSLFPNTPASRFWVRESAGRKDHAYTISFDNNGVASMPKDTLLYVRLVKGRN